MSLIGKALKLTRSLDDKTLKETALGIKVSSGYLCDLENDKKTPSIEFINKFSKHFKVSPSALFLFSENLGKAKSKIDFRSAVIRFLQNYEEGL